MIQFALHRRNGWLFLVLVTVGISACAPTHQKRESALVQGMVTYKNEPLKMGTVIFQPESGAFSSGEIQANGTYSLQAVLGPNRVQIVCRDPEDDRPMTEISGPRKTSKSYIPEHYGTPNSPLQFTVEDADNVADFALKD